MANKKTYFNELWLNPNLHPELSSCICPVENNNNQALCKLCKKIINLSNMGKRALLSHIKGQLHTKNMGSIPNRKKSYQHSVSTLLSKQSAESETRSLSVSVTRPNKEFTNHIEPTEAVNNYQSSDAELKYSDSQRNLDKLLDDVTKAEIIWCLHMVYQKLPFNFCNNLNVIFKLMFPQCPIATAFSLGYVKAAYFIVHGLAPFFQNKLLSNLSQCDFLTFHFHEALNEVVKGEQMDVVVRVWNKENQTVFSRYLTSVFFNGSKIEDLLKQFLDGISPISLSKLIQVSVDGSNMTLEFVKCLQNHLQLNGREKCTMLNLGACEVHILHESFKMGIESVKWDLGETLNNLYTLFNYCYDTKTMFTECTGCDSFPLRFCCSLSLENGNCFDRALEIWDHLTKFFYECPLHKTKLITNLEKEIYDPFMKCRLAFCKEIVDECQSFLSRFKSSKPMTPYLFEAVEKLLRGLMSRCIKPDLLNCSGSQLLCVDLKNSENFIPIPVDDMFTDSSFFASEMMTFLHDCRRILTIMIEKLQDNSPLKYKAVEGLSSLNPSTIKESPNVAQARFVLLLEELETAEIINNITAEKAKEEFSNLCNLDKSDIEELFNQCDELSEKIGLDYVYRSFLMDNNKYEYLWKVIEISLILSHGIPRVDNESFVNKSLTLENKREKTIIAKRQILYEINEAEGIQNIEITKEMIESVRNSRKRYSEYLDSVKSQTLAEEMKKAKKRRTDYKNEEMREQLCK